jgi:hypothetical protein
LTRENNHLKIFFSDGWYLVHHLIQIDLEILDWKKIYSILDEASEEVSLESQNEILKKLELNIIQMINSENKYKKMKKKEKNDLKLLMLLITGKLKIGQKILFTGLDFVQDQKGEELADKEAYEIDGHVEINLNDITPITDQNIKLGVYKKQLLPTELKVIYSQIWVNLG